MDCLNAIAERYSYRGAFLDKPVSRDDLTKIAAAAAAAPSGCNKQTTRFVMIDDAGLLSKIGALHPMAAMQTARAMMAFVVDCDPKPVYQDLSFQVEDCAAAVQNALLAIADLGYASVWIDGALRRDGRAEAIGKWLNIPEGKVVRVLLPIGVPAENGPRPDKMPVEERAWFNRYGSAC